MDVMHSNIFDLWLVNYLTWKTRFSANERKKHKCKKLVKAFLCVFCVHLRTNKIILAALYL